MKLLVPLILLACICATPQAWGGLVVAGNAGPLWLSINTTVILTQYSCEHRPALQDAQNGVTTASHVSRTGHYGTTGLRSSGAGGLPGFSKKYVTVDLPPAAPFPPGLDDQIPHPFTPGIDDQIQLPVASTSTTPVDGGLFDLSPGTTEPSTEQIVSELAADSAATNIGPDQNPPLLRSDIAATHAVPEPGSLTLLLLGLLALMSCRFRNRLR